MEKTSAVLHVHMKIDINNTRPIFVLQMFFQVFLFKLSLTFVFIQLGTPVAFILVNHLLLQHTQMTGYLKRNQETTTNLS